jgi:hypothetical protein
MKTDMQSLLTVSGILLGFLFTGFWWLLKREVSFGKDGRHFKLCYWLIFVAMLLLGICGVIVPLHALTADSSAAYACFVGVTVALILVFGYMFAELGHYDVFQTPHYVTKSEKLVVVVTAAIALTVAALLLLLKP